jgi:acetamidase/formamidase
MHHRLDRSVSVTRWDRETPPRLTVSPGDAVTAELRDASDGQVHPGMSHEAFGRIDDDRIHALAGPIEVDGAEPGDVVEVHLQAYDHEGWGWTGIVPGLGLLPDEFTEPYLQIWEFDGDRTRSLPGVTVPLDPFCGIVGVQRAERGSFRTRPPGPWGGNVDVQHLTAGSVLSLPVYAEGAGLCVGDGHAAQGDGEVCVTGIEAPMTVRFEVRLRTDRSLAGPELRTPAPDPDGRPASRSRAFVASAETAEAAAEGATRRALSFVHDRTDLSREQAYVLCSVALDLRLSQLVNEPMVTVTGYLSESIFDSGLD